MFEGKKNRQTRFGNVEKISLERELELADIIIEYKSLFDVNKNSLSGKDLKNRKLADKAVEELVSGYSMLIEKIAEERYSSSGGYGGDWEDYVSASYVVAVQCARTFNPHKGRNTIRFSSYVARAISSKLSRLAMSSRSIVHVPTSTMTNARKWSHTYFDMIHRGLKPTDEQVSEISGVDMTQQEALRILGLNADSPIDNERPPEFRDEPFEDYEKMRRELIDAIRGVIPQDYVEGTLLILGLEDGSAKTTPFSISSMGAMSKKEASEKLDMVKSLFNHPSVRTKIAKIINHDGTQSRNVER